ncbi:MAG: arabinan endo-1,5-alpha-L-arabinosidase [Brevundimonas sp.]|nr:arabinan endo-1,5-alpha-L-arabinosidase [Brevundimonas sp.]
MAPAPRQLPRRAVLGAALAASGCAAVPAIVSAASINARMRGDISPVHDPCIIRQGDTAYLFSTTGSAREAAEGLIPIRTSRDLIHWQRAGHVLAELPEWARQAVPDAAGAWAPDIAHFNGRFHLYYSVSTFGSNHSVIGLVSSPTLNPSDPAYAWRDDGQVIASTRQDDFNAIDSNVVRDLNGDWWISWGSFWTGLKIARMDPGTGKPSDDRVHAIARRPEHPGAVEAPFIITHHGWHYLFASFDLCCRGLESSYTLVVGRSRDVLGPYLDREGRDMMQGGGSPIIAPSPRYPAFGHNAVLQDAGQDYLVFHAYDRDRDSAPVLRVSPIAWSADGWPGASL